MAVVAHPLPESDAEVRRLRTLYRLLAALSHAKGIEEVYDAALTSLLEATLADRAAILLFDDDGVIRFKAARGLSGEYQAAVTGHSPWSRGARDAQSFGVSDVLVDEALQGYRDVFQHEGIRALGFVPLALNDGVLGKFMLYYAEPHHCTRDELEVAEAIAAHIALATERKQAEMARVRVEQRLQGILDNSVALIWVKDPQGRYELVNRRYAELFHVDAGRTLGMTDYDLFPAELADRFLANDRVVLDSGRPLAVEEHAPHPDGLHTYLSVKFPLMGPDGRVAAVCGIATDITDRKRLETAGQQLAAIVESSEDAIISKDLNGIIRTWNKAAEQMYGYTAKEVLGKPVSILSVPGHNEMPDILAMIRRGERVDHFETRRRRKDGSMIDVALTVSPVRDSAGTIVGASKIARDITDRKRIEQERAELLAREQEARRTAELLNRVAPRLTAQLDLEKLVQEVTDIATTLVGAEYGSFLQDVASHPAFRPQGVTRYSDQASEHEYPYYGMPAGQPPMRSYLAAPVVSRTGEVLGGLFFGHSQPERFTATHEEIITGIAAQAAIAMDNARLFEQAQWIQTELKRSNEELRRANRDLEVFAYSASHDLQEPLRTIAISAQLLQRTWGPRLEGDDALFLTNILTASKRMGSLTEDLLAYMRASKSAEGPVPCVDAGHVMAGVLESLHVQIQEAGATVASGELPMVAIHEGRLAQIFQNLIGNAIKYRRQESPRVHVSAEVREGFHVFSLADNGIGIPPQFAEQIFGLFKRLHGQDQYPGSGVGLAICQRVIEQYGGQIWLEQSVPGQGSTFCFSLPV
jgi:PAS domain S-box-containing protein